MSSTRVFVIGLDGATFDLLHPWIEEGRLPTLGKLMKTSSYGPLRSTIPPVTAPAWTSFMTGVNPGKHGIYDFISFKADSSEKILVNSTHIRSKRVWDLAGTQGKRSIILNVPLTYPPQKIEGIMVSGFPLPEQGEFIYPKEMGRELEEKVGPWWKEIGGELFRNFDEDLFFREACECFETRLRVVDFLMEKDWDLFVIVTMETDRLQHLMWEKKEERLLPFYQRVDEGIGNFINRLEDRDFLIILSDHGFGPEKKTLYLNTWLKERGFLKSRKRWVRSDPGIEVEVPHRKATPFLHRIRRAVGKRKEVIDWEETVACFFDTGLVHGIGINLKGREPKGAVDPRDYEKIRNRIMEEVRELKDEEGERVIQEIYKREDLYQGPFVNRAPDIVLVPDFAYTFSNRIRDFISKKRQDHRGVHRLNGIFFLRGPGVRKGKKMEGAQIIDVAPTILHLLGLPVPRGMDGRVLTEAFESDFLQSTPVCFDGTPLEVDLSKYEMTEKEAEDVKKMLKGLGYID